MFKGWQNSSNSYNGSMQTLPAREAKNSFGRLIDMSQAGPVAIEKHGRPVAMMISIAEFERLSAFDDAYWLAMAEKGEKSGYLGAEESEKFLAELGNAED
jgi:prevent-host-death family protein